MTLFSVISSSLSAAISRFITYEIGKGNVDRLNRIFATSVIIQIFISLAVLIVAEIVGVWFMRSKMQIPDGRLDAAYWVLHCSVITFCINLLSVPYNACIIAHEHMKAFAYVSVIEVSLRLAICYLIAVSPIDRLISYAILTAITSLAIRIIYTTYCHRHFEESRTKLLFDKFILREMFGFAGWSFFNNSVSIFNNQGVNMLINVFFGVSLNAARGVANQVENAVMQFVNNFTLAVNPQITKSYAAGDLTGMHCLVCRGARFSYFMMLLMSLPLICEADTILHIWLKVVPPHAVSLVQLSLVLGLVDSVGFSGYTACMATGKLRTYSLAISSIGVLEFPLSWLAFSMGGSIEMCYYIYVTVKAVVLVVRMFLLQSMVGLKVRMYTMSVFVPIILTTLVAMLPSLLIINFLPSTFLRLIFSVIIGVAVRKTAASDFFNKRFTPL